MMAPVYQRSEREPSALLIQKHFDLNPEASAPEAACCGIGAA